MSMFQRLLVAYDGSAHSEKALEKAIEYMKIDSNVQTHVVNVTHPPSWNLYSLYGPYISQDMIQEMDEASNKTLSDAKKLMSEFKDSCHFERLQGYASQKIIDYANEHKIDLIILGSRGLGAFKGMLLGSVSLHVVQHAECHVLVVK